MSGNKGNNNTNLSDVIAAFKQENYSRANELLKKAKVTQEQSGLAKQIKVSINNELAISLCNSSNYADAIVLITNNLNTQPKSEFPLDINKSLLIKGIAELYNADYKQAFNTLVFTQNDNNYKPFIFYYILAGIYGNLLPDYKTYKDLTNAFSDINTVLSENKQLYLQAVFALFNKDIKAFCTILRKIKPESRQQTINMEYLISLSKVGKKNLLNKDIKPLYKLIAGLELTPDEEKYLNTFPILKSSFEKDKVNSALNLIIDGLNNLSLYGTPLDDAVFNSILHNSDFNDIFNQIVYNQIISLFNNRYNINNAKTVAHKYIQRYRDIFFSFPDSIYPYLKLCEDSNITFELFLTNFNYYLGIHAKNMTPMQIEVIGILLYVFILASTKQELSAKVIKQLSGFSSLRENITGISLIQLQDYFFALKHTKPDISAVSLFLNPDCNEFNKFLDNQFNIFFSSFPETDVYSKGNYVVIIHNFINILKLDFQPHPRAKIFLVFIKYFIGFIQKICKDFKIKLKANETRLINDYYIKTIEYFKENRKGTSYYNDYISLKNTDLLNSIVKYINKNNFGKLLEEYQKSIQNGSEDIFQDFIYRLFKNDKSLSQYKIRDISLINIVKLIHLLFEGYHKDSSDISNDKTKHLINLFFPEKDNDDIDNFAMLFLLEILKKLKDDDFTLMACNILYLFVDKLTAYPYYSNKQKIVLMYINSLIELKISKTDFCPDHDMLLKFADYLLKSYYQKKSGSILKLYNYFIFTFNLKIQPLTPPKPKNIKIEKIIYYDPKQYSLFD